jgi:cobalt-zinc-cadmium efflux system protein
VSTDKGRLRFALALTAVVFVAELVTGILTGSLALVADSAHMFLDAFAIALSLTALYLSSLPATEHRTFGWHRAEVLAALANGVLLGVVAVEIFIHAIERLSSPREVIVLPMIVVAAVGLVTNLVVAFRLHGSDRRDINLRGAYLHVIGDMMASVAVVAGGVVIWITGKNLIDAILAMAIACLVLFGALRLLRDALHLLLDGVPRHIKVSEVSNAIAAVPGVTSVHDIHVWAICSHILSLSCHLRVDRKTRPENAAVINEINEAIAHRFGIMHSTIQIDDGGPEDEPMISQDLNHGAAHAHGHDHEH